MAVMKMMRMEVIALQSDAKRIVEYLQRAGVVEISYRDDVPEPEESELIQLETHASITQFDKTLQQVNAAISVLDEYAPVKKPMLDSFKGRRELTLPEFSKRSHQIEESLHTARDIIALSQKIQDARSVISHTRTQLDSLLPWEGLQIPMQFEGTVHTAALIGSLPSQYTAESLGLALEEAAEILISGEAGGSDIHGTDDGHREESTVEPTGEPLLPPVHIHVVSSSPDLTCVAVFCLKEHEETVRGALRRIGFSLPSDPTTHPPAVRIGRFRKRIADAQQETEQVSRQAAAYGDWRERLEFLSDYYLMRRDKYEVLGNLRFSRNTFVLEGYIPEKCTEMIREALEFFGASVVFENPREDEDVPVQLENNPLVYPVEDIVQSYSMPSKDDVDPNPVMAFFYYLFFGMMLSDAGYGLLMVLITAAVLRFLKPEGNMKRNVQKFLLCGLSTVFWGSLFGSWFGNIVYSVSTTFFGRSVNLAPLWFDPVAEPLRLLILSLVLGFIHVMAGLALNFYNQWRHGKKIDALFDIGLWWVVFAGLGLVIASLAVTVAFPLKTTGLWIAAAGAAGLVLTQGRSSKSIPGKIMGGIASLYSITAYFSDILSYSRLMALGLVTGIIGTVINTIGSIGGGGIKGALIFIPIFIFGHTINIGINVLGAYVHDNRLQYVEFFSKFYEGGGKAFKPFGMNTKKYKFKEEN